MSQTFASRVWRAFGLKPHLDDTWKLSSDPQFVDKVRDVVGLYLDPPERAVVLCVDEKSQTQALARSRPILSLLPTSPARASHDYVRNGTTDLFAALDIATGRVHTQMHSRHRTTEFRTFLNHLDREVPNGLDVHLILDNYATHKTPAIHRVAAPPPPLPPPLHPDQRLMAEPGGAVVRRAHHQEAAPLLPRQRRRTRRRHHRVDQRLGRRPQALHLGQNRRHLRIHRKLLPADLELGTLE